MILIPVKRVLPHLFCICERAHAYEALRTLAWEENLYTPCLLAKFTLLFYFKLKHFPVVSKVFSWCFLNGLFFAQELLSSWSSIPHLAFLFSLKLLSSSWVSGVLFYPGPFALGKPQGLPALSVTPQDPASGSINWLPELLTMSVLPTHSQMSQTPAVSDRDLSTSTHVGLPCKVFIICRLLHRVATSCDVSLSHSDWACFQSTCKLNTYLIFKTIHVTVGKQDLNQFSNRSIK